jgi:predicted nucleic acid-binding protein
MSSLILDSEGVSVLARSKRGIAFDRAQGYLVGALRTQSQVIVPAAVLAEQYRGGRFDQPIDAFFARHKDAITIVDTDRPLARIVGNLLAEHNLATAQHVDATVVATAARAGGGVILTADPGDIAPLAQGLPGIFVISLS